MSRSRVILIAAVVIVVAVLIGLSTINTEAPLTHVEKPVPNATLGH